MTARRLLFFIALSPVVASPLVAAMAGLLVGVAAFYGGIILAGAVALWPLTEREIEHGIHRSIARNLSGADPR